ncbi:hypothetical protein [Saccharothrix sp. ALI-22-I]|uniref:hypothetical protein n=1 Tax=Saccharothrix sp. ALI-22-I TaxID=1933778 RepID=UPI0015C367D7|nr:hypothetical protein [Saccharothrix sp. ALI-22-I]
MTGGVFHGTPAKGQLAVFGEGDALRFAAAPHQDSCTPKLELYVMAGRPIRESFIH